MENPASNGSHKSEGPAKPDLCNGEPGDAAKPCLADWDGDKAVAFLKEVTPACACYCQSLRVFAHASLFTQCVGLNRLLTSCVSTSQRGMT